MSDYIYRLTLTGSEVREVRADRWSNANGWAVFYVKPPQGGALEITRVRLDCIVSIDTD